MLTALSTHSWLLTESQHVSELHIDIHHMAISDSVANAFVKCLHRDRLVLFAVIG